MTPKNRNEFGEHEQRTPGDRRSGCVVTPEPPSPVCAEKMARLREYVDGRFEANAEALVLKAKETDAHFLLLNNAQARLDRDRDDFIKKDNYDTQHKYLVERVDSLSGKVKDINIWIARLEGKASRSNTISGIAVAVSLLIAVLHFIQGLK